MTKISELLAKGKTLSFELFPPRSAEGEVQLQETLTHLDALHPSFVSITYGAAGSTRKRTHQLVHRLLQSDTAVPMAHLTTAAHTKAELTEILSDYGQAGLDNVLALRGDPPLKSNGDVKQGELTRAIELVALARATHDFCIAVAMHPEGHPREPSRRIDRTQQAEKLRTADFGITQFFFNAEDYLRLVEDVAWYGVEKPIIPGIMAPTHIAQLKRMAEMSGAAIPYEIESRLTAAGDNLEEAHKVGVDIATSLCAELLEMGVPGLHFYTMNRSNATSEICQNLKLDGQHGPELVEKELLPHE
jgi:methylenetetrahydrofolate reductase (NADPH)